jgi:hypothetical protein
VSEFCRHRNDDDGKLCGQPAKMIVWGKLFPPDALGPRCYDHAAEQIGHRAAGDRSPGYAIYHFPRDAA